MIPGISGRAGAPCATMTVAALIGAGAVVAGAAGVGHASGDGTDTMYGDPQASARYWRYQSFDDCGPVAVAEVVGQLTGREPSEDAILRLAAATPSPAHPGQINGPSEETGDPTSGRGTSAGDAIVLLGDYGIHATYTDQTQSATTGLPTGLGALEQQLAAGHAVIAGVNGETIWHRRGDTQRNDHAVVVTGVDTSAGTAHLNDSGTPIGQDEKVDIDTFMRAWAASGDGMIVTAETTSRHPAPDQPPEQ